MIGENIPVLIGENIVLIIKTIFSPINTGIFNFNIPVLIGGNIVLIYLY